MKKAFVFLISAGICGFAFAKTVCFDIPDNQIKMVEVDVVNAEQWIKDMWRGKVNNCKKRIIRSEIDWLRRNGQSVPASDDDILRDYFKSDRYKPRTIRDAESIEPFLNPN